MEIKRNGSQPSAKGPADWFTGTVRIDPLFSAEDPARTGAATVTFEPGARTAWHAVIFIDPDALGWPKPIGGRVGTRCPARTRTPLRLGCHRSSQQPASVGYRT